METAETITIINLDNEQEETLTFSDVVRRLFETAEKIATTPRKREYLSVALRGLGVEWNLLLEGFAKFHHINLEVENIHTRFPEGWLEELKRLRQQLEAIFIKHFAQTQDKKLDLIKPQQGWEIWEQEWETKVLPEIQALAVQYDVALRQLEPTQPTQ